MLQVGDGKRVTSAIVYVGSTLFIVPSPAREIYAPITVSMTRKKFPPRIL